MSYTLTMTEHASMATPTDPDEAPVHQADAGTQFVGLVLFLGSLAVMFAALFFSFALYRVQVASAWPPAALLDVPLWMPTLSTALILLSSGILQVSRRNIVAGDLRRARWGVFATFAVALLFVAMQTWLWSTMWSQGTTLSAGRFAGFFYLLTVFHALHVVVGLGLLAYLARRLKQGDVAAVGAPARLITLFWHFVGIVWCLLFLLLFFT